MEKRRKESFIKHGPADMCRLMFPAKIKWALLLVSLISNSVYGQFAVIPRPHDRGLGKATVIDTTSIQFYYAFNAEDIKKTDSYEDYQCLEVGKEWTRYYSISLVEGERKVGKWLEEHPKAESVPNVSTAGRRSLYWSEYQYAELYTQKNQQTGYYCFPLHLTKYNAYCQENYPLQTWTIQKDTMSVCGQLCQKAICHFRGRDFVAWFAPKIPLRYGPWKYGGLPGIILKITDTKGDFSFECVKIERKKKPMQKYSFPKYVLKKNAEVIKLQHTIGQNYFRAVGGHGGNIPLDFNFPHKQLELGER